MAPPGTESKTLRYLQEKDLAEAVDCKSDTDYMEHNGSPLATTTGEDDTSRLPSPFPDQGAVDTLITLRNPSDTASAAVVTTRQAKTTDCCSREKRKAQVRDHGSTGEPKTICL